MTQPIASATVTLAKPVKGSELMAAVKAVIESDKSEHSSSSFHADQRYDNGDVFTVGQYSMYPYDQILVAPEKDSADIRPDQDYQKVEVMSHSWPFGSVYCIGYENDSVVSAVKKFAGRLNEHLNTNVTDSAGESVWPQDLVVCALCDTIVWRASFDGYHCPKDGANPPTKTVKVVLVTD